MPIFSVAFRSMRVWYMCTTVDALRRDLVFFFDIARQCPRFGACALLSVASQRDEALKCAGHGVGWGRRRLFRRVISGSGPALAGFDRKLDTTPPHLVFFSLGTLLEKPCRSMVLDEYFA
jgi:hypothetical protein